MTKQNILSLFNGLNICGNLTGRQFGYFVSRNISLLKPEVEKIEQTRKELVENYAKKENGKTLIVDNDYVFEDKETFEVEFQKLLNEDIELKTFMIFLEEIPEHITVQQLTGIYELITE